MQSIAVEGTRKARASAGNQLMKICIAGESNRFTNLEHSMSARQPAGLLACTAKLRKSLVRLRIGRGEKRFHQRADRNIALRILPALRHDLPVFIQQKVGEFGI